MSIYPSILFRESSYLDYYEFTEHFIFDVIGLNKRILDIGCRNGLFTGRIFRNTNAREIIGIDIDPNVIEEANKLNANEKINYYIGDGEDITLLSKLGKFDVIHIRNTFHHFNKPEKFLVNITQLLNPKGIICIVDIDRESMVFNLGKFSFGELVTWFTIIKKLGLIKALSTIKKVGFLSEEYRLHHNEDILRQKSIGWYRKHEIRNALCRLFPHNYHYGRIGSLLGVGGVYYFLYRNMRGEK